METATTRTLPGHMEPAERGAVGSPQTRTLRFDGIGLSKILHERRCSAEDVQDPIPMRIMVVGESLLPRRRIIVRVSGE